ncbi:uncharacterized protein LOC116778238 [Danaus plexippus]|uniref:uncharacterized protein LOC116778238 n=1 Tax=Danaus plexippus TaxID=13037 RepID=UPI002AAFE742|nr:uncharacterized protein LOC116778238 [Danaus plexippus]
MYFITIALLSVYGQSDARHQSVNLNLETSLLFEPGDENSTLFLEKIQNLLDQIKHAISAKPVFRNRDDDVFTNFLNNFLNVLVKYDGKDLKMFIQKLNIVFKKMFNSNVIFSENSKSIIQDFLKEHAYKESDELKSYVRMTTDNKNDILLFALKEFNKFYNKNDAHKMDDVITRLDKKIKKNMSKIIKQALNIMFVDKFKELDETMRNEFKTILDTFLKNFSKNGKSNLDVIDEILNIFVKQTNETNYDSEGTGKELEKNIVLGDVEILVRNEKNNE